MKRINYLFITIAIMVLSFSGTVYAIEREDGLDTVVYEDIETTDTSVMTNLPVYDYIEPGTTGNLYPELNPYIGLFKTFTVNAVSQDGSGILYLYLYDPNGDLKSDDWIISINEVYTWDLFLPISGKWHLEAVAPSINTAAVELTAVWND